MKELVFLLCLFILAGCDYRNSIYISHNDVGNSFSMNYKNGARHIEGKSTIRYYTPEQVSKWVSVIKSMNTNTYNHTDGECVFIEDLISLVQNEFPGLVRQYRGLSKLTSEEICEKITTVPLGGWFMIQTSRQKELNNIDRDNYYLEYIMKIDGMEVFRSSDIVFLYPSSNNFLINDFLYFGANIRVEQPLRNGSEVVIDVLDHTHNTIDTFTLTYLDS